MLRLRWCAQLHAVAGARLHQRISERRAPTDVAAVEVHLVDADDRDDGFEAGGVLVGHGCREETPGGGSRRFHCGPRYWQPTLRPPPPRAARASVGTHARPSTAAIRRA